MILSRNIGYFIAIMSIFLTYVRPCLAMSCRELLPDLPGVRVTSALSPESRYFQSQNYRIGALLEPGQNEIAVFKPLEPEFKYLGLVTSYHGSQHFFRALDGVEFTVPHAPFLELWKDPTVRKKKLQDYLRGVSAIVRSGQVNHELDSFFQRTKDGSQSIYTGLRTSSSKDPRDEYWLGLVPGTSYHEVFVKRTRHTERLVIESYDTEIREELGGRDPFVGPRYGKDVNFHRENGEEKRNQLLDEILSFVFPLYSERRGWPPSFLQTLREKAFRLANQTRSIVIRRRENDDSPGEIIATISLHRSVYGKVKFFDRKGQLWKEATGSFGNMFREAIGQAAETDFLHPYAPKFWSRPVSLLGMEEYFGRGAFLERPTVVEDVEIPNLVSRDIFSRGGRLERTDWEPSPRHPMHFYSGIIFEPKTFGIAKKNDLRGISYSELLLELFQAVFHSHRDLDYNLNAQRLYTYNDASGALLYKAMGFTQSVNQPKLQKDGVEWQILSLDPKTMLQNLKDPEFLRRRLPEDFAKALSDSIARMMERRSP